MNTPHPHPPAAFPGRVPGGISDSSARQARDGRGVAHDPPRPLIRRIARRDGSPGRRAGSGEGWRGQSGSPRRRARPSGSAEAIVGQGRWLWRGGRSSPAATPATGPGLRKGSSDARQAHPQRRAPPGRAASRPGPGRPRSSPPTASSAGAAEPGTSVSRRGPSRIPPDRVDPYPTVAVQPPSTAREQGCEQSKRSRGRAGSSPPSAARTPQVDHRHGPASGWISSPAVPP